LPGVLHAGVLFFDIRGKHEVMLLHLGMHHALRCEEPTGYHWVELSIIPERARLIARLCRKIEQRYPDGKLKYALSYTGGAFAADGAYLTESGRGLTCVTFVLAVFAGQGVSLIQSDAWPVRDEDKKAQLAIVALIESEMKKNQAGLEGAELEAARKEDHEHLEAVRKEVGCARFRAEEVAAAGASPSTPADFTYSSSQGVIVKKMLLKAS